MEWMMADEPGVKCDREISLGARGLGVMRAVMRDTRGLWADGLSTSGYLRSTRPTWQGDRIHTARTPFLNHEVLQPGTGLDIHKTEIDIHDQFLILIGIASTGSPIIGIIPPYQLAFALTTYKHKPPAAIIPSTDLSSGITTRSQICNPKPGDLERRGSQFSRIQPQTKSRVCSISEIITCGARGIRQESKPGGSDSLFFE
jgi:hypothetical protein